jgi:hypothetical protein
MSLFRKRPSRLDRVLAEHDAAEAALQAQAIPPGSRIFTSWSPKITVAHVWSALNPGAVCEAMSQRTGPWLGVNSAEEKARALSLRLCHRCKDGDYGDGSKP